MRQTSVYTRPLFRLALLLTVATAIGASVPTALAEESTPSPSSAAPAPAAEPLGSTGTLPGIDVSHWQGAIDWMQVAAAGVRFAIAKATEGTDYTDPTYALNKAGAAAQGVPFTAYHFAKPDASVRDAVREADHFVEVADLGPGNLVPALDLERTGGLSQADLTRWALRWLGRVTVLLGVRPMVYTGPNGWRDRTGDTSAIADAGYTVLWIAHWNVAAPSVPGGDWGGNGWTFWQFSDCAAVPGIDGCVDADRFAGTSLARVTIPSPDTTPPTASIRTPGDLGDAAVVTFSEPVRDVTPGNVLLWQPDIAQPIPVTLSCASRTGTPVDCAAGPVRTASLRPQRPLAAAQAYTVYVAPDGVLPAVVDRAGNPATAARADFATAAGVEENSSGLVYGWRTETDRRAAGREYLTEHTAGARLSFPFVGRSVTWLTVAGPEQGRAEVFVDGRSQGVFDQYARRTTFGVARRFSGLSAGSHTIAVEVLGTRARAVTDARVAVDAFAVGRDLVANPRGTPAWRTTDVDGASGGAVATNDTRGASVSFAFRGTGVEWMTVRGPRQGRAAVFVDGDLVRTVDNYADRPASGVVRTVDGLIIGEHTVRIVVLGESRSKASGAGIAVDRLSVVP